MIDRALLAKIKKCLALASSSNEHEAAAALAKARALMEEHGITDAQIAMADIEEATARASRTQRPPRWEEHLSAAVCRALNVVGFINHVGDRSFVGRGPAPEIATYAFTALFRRLKAARAEYIAKHLRRCKPGRKRQRADIYCQAWAYAVASTIEKLVQAQPEDTLIGQYLADRHPGLVTVDTRSAALKGGGVWNDYMRGHLAGSEVDLSSPIGGTATTAMLT